MSLNTRNIEPFRNEAGKVGQLGSGTCEKGPEGPKCQFQAKFQAGSNWQGIKVPHPRGRVLWAPIGPAAYTRAAHALGPQADSSSAYVQWPFVMLRGL
ncbi:hypothetical protein RUM43_007021 [Polyplax serrata]|uniref:Uncharacterized protein n=1 Tax=Polyplax serrata TaxID=468196 RepID=A0AAN8PLR7_POLSC